jgi:hypothetical protein
LYFVFFFSKKGFSEKLVMSSSVDPLCDWYIVRDTLFGSNKCLQNVKKAFELAAVCDHELARWLLSLFADHTVTNKVEVQQVFLALGNDDARALCFGACMQEPVNMDMVERAARLGDALAQATIAKKGDVQSKWSWAEKAARQGEREGFFELGTCYMYGYGCTKDETKAKELYLRAAKLGLVEGMSDYGCLLKKSDPERYVWLAKSCSRGGSLLFFTDLLDQMRNFNAGNGHASVVFAMGRALRKQINVEKRTIFGKFEGTYLRGPARDAVQFYKDICQAARRAVDVWSIVGRRVRIVKDVRLIISRLLWNARDEWAVK